MDVVRRRQAEMRNTSGNSLAMTSIRVYGKPSDGMYWRCPRCGSDSIPEQFQGNGYCAKQATRPAVEQLRVGRVFELPSPDNATMMKCTPEREMEESKAFLSNIELSRPCYCMMTARYNNFRLTILGYTKKIHNYFRPAIMLAYLMAESHHNLSTRARRPAVTTRFHHSLPSGEL